MNVIGIRTLEMCTGSQRFVHIFCTMAYAHLRIGTRRSRSKGFSSRRLRRKTLRVNFAHNFPCGVVCTRFSPGDIKAEVRNHRKRSIILFFRPATDRVDIPRQRTSRSPASFCVTHPIKISVESSTRSRGRRKNRPFDFHSIGQFIVIKIGSF